MRLGLLVRHTLAVLLVVYLGGCKLFDTTCAEDDRDCLSAGIFAAGLGGECVRTADCKEGLFCEDRECVAKGLTARGDKCRLTAECGDADYCGNLRVCQIAGLTEEGGDCTTTGNCIHGLVCSAPDLTEQGVVSLSALASVSGACEEAGTREQGEECEDLVDCLAGLHCIEIEIEGETSRRCASLPPLDQEIPAIPAFWEGVACGEVDESDDAVAYFEVPRESDENVEFYKLPFPNDIRLTSSGSPDMSGHPAPDETSGLPFVKRYIEVAEEDLDGWATNPVVLFRFNQPYLFDTVNGDTVQIVDITPDSPDYNMEASIEWKVTKGNLSNYICPHWLGLRRPVGTPLRSGTTYAAIVTTGVRPENGSQYARSSDLSDMLSGSAPSDATLNAAWDKYQPLRDWISDQNLNADGILNATVFTTQSAEGGIDGLRGAIGDEPVPTVSDLFSCADGGDSPCQMRDRGACKAESADFTEVHARIALPMVQAGTLPYEDPEDGGGMVWSGSTPEVQSTRDVCMAISVPVTAPPMEGYPVLVYAHGTGGTFNGQMSSAGIARAAALATEPAVLVAIDLPMHGERNGDDGSAEEPPDPDALFFNFLNPRAARDNVLQGSADLMSVVRWAAAGGLSAEESPTGDAVPFNPARIALMGHSQGATHTSLMMSYTPSASGVVLSGNGGHLSSSLMTKTSPVDIAAVLPLGLLDPDDEFELAGGGYNPALAIIQMVFERADPVNFAARIRREPTSVVPEGQHVFMTYGLGDTFSTEETLGAYAKAARFTHVEPVLVDVGLSSASTPLSLNADVGGTPRTVGMRQYAPTADSDGHFVATSPDQDGRADVERFLDAVLAGGDPEIGPSQ